MSRFCVSEGTMITLKDKTRKPIEEIIIGEELLVFDLETLQKSQKYDILVKLSTNDFRGIFQDSVVKNIWTNTSDKYYLINKKLKITGDHILLANRDNKYYWTKVEKLQLKDLLFTEMNIFEYIHSIEIINEKIDVYNLEVNTYYNYFANSYLIHNGAPCSACSACGGGLTSFAFTPHNYASYSYANTNHNNWVSVGNGTARGTNADPNVVNSSTNTWSDGTNQNTLESITSLKSIIDSDIGTTTDAWKWSRKVALRPGHPSLNDRSPDYSARGVMPLINTTDEAEIWFKVTDLGTGSQLWGIGLMHKFVSESGTFSSSWLANTESTLADTYLRPANSDAGGRIQGDTKLAVRFKTGRTAHFDTNVWGSNDSTGSHREIHTFRTVSSSAGSSSNTTITLTPASGGGTGLSGGMYIYGHGIKNTVRIDSNGVSNNTIYLSGSVSVSPGDIIGFSNSDFSLFASGGGYSPNNVVAGMGYLNENPYDGDQTGSGERDGSNYTNGHTNNLPAIPDVNDKVGIIITIDGDESGGTGGQKVTFKHYQNSTETTTTMLEKYIPTHIFYNGYRELKSLADFDGTGTHEGAWAVYVFDSTTGDGNRWVDLEICNPP